MALKLNTSREAYKEFYGKNTEQMPKLIAEGRVPMSVAGLMQRRLDVRHSHTKVEKSYMDNYFDTGDGIVYHPDGRVKIVLDSQHLRNMTPDTQRKSGALVLTAEDYDILEGEEFKKGKLRKTGAWLSRADVKAHPIWKALARDQTLLNDYTDFVFGKYQGRFVEGKALNDLKLMGIFPGSANGDTPEIRAWYVNGYINGLKGKSDANGQSYLDYDSGCLLGIIPEVLSTPGKGASNIKSYTIADLQAFDKAINGLEGTLHPDVLKPFADLRKKL